ncbi:MAG: DNA polymerase I [Acidobacteria bacterium]|nr:DNA polymerase I [Acidobacteriota bacterium]
MTRKKLVLIDAMSNVFRAYYAIQRLTNRQGMRTNAIFGFTTMLRKVLKDEQPDYIAVVFDTAEPTFRHEVLPTYKGNRAEMPDDLSVQMPYIFNLCEALRIPMLKLPGYEADDIIGTLARQAAEEGMDVVIVSNDKDMCQLVNGHIVVVKADRQTTTVLDRKGVEERLGVPPEQVVDVLALWGDASDNIPGAPGIGEKGSVQIIKQFGSVEKALENWQQVQRKSYRESLRDNQEQILRARELVTIKTDVPIEIDWEALRYQGPDSEKTYTLFTELDFSSLIKDFVDMSQVSAEAVSAQAVEGESVGDYRIITAEQEAQQVLDALWARDRFAFMLDCEADELRGVSLATQPHAARYIDLQKSQVSMEVLREAFENGLLAKSTYDLKQAIKLFKPKNVSIEGTVDDVMIAAWLLDPNRGKYPLSAMAQEHLGLEMAAIEPPGVIAHQADVILQLSDRLREKLKEAGLEQIYEQMELPLIEILAEMELAGVRVDPAVLQDVAKEIDAELEQLCEKIYREAGRQFNINSPQQLAEVFDELKIEITQRTKKTGRISTSADVLEELAATYPIARLVLDYRELAKLKGTYVDALPKLFDPRTGRIHTTFEQTGTSTGRLSSKGPNLQNIPVRSAMGREIRKAFVADPDHRLVSADYSQIDLRVLAHMTGDEAMIRAFCEGRDIHAEVARTVFGAQTKEEEREFRRLAKIVNFAIAYGIGAFGLAQRVGLPRREAQQVIENYYKTYPGVYRYMQEIPELARRQGYVRSLCGRIRPIPEINDKNFNIRQRAEREAINAPIQGGSADIFKLGMIRVDGVLKRAGLKARMILQVHDELLLEVPDNEVQQVEQLVKEEMEKAYPLNVPLVVEVGEGKNWLEVK